MVSYRRCASFEMRADFTGAALNLINSVGNTNHKGMLKIDRISICSDQHSADLMIDRTTVYSFELSELREKAEKNTVVALFVSDGVYVF